MSSPSMLELEASLGLLSLCHHLDAPIPLPSLPSPLNSSPTLVLASTPLSVEQTRGQRQAGRNDLPGKGEKVAKWMVRVESKKC